MLLEKVSSLPEKPGVYIFKTKSWKVLYVWKAKNLKKRVKQYFSSDIWVWKEDMISRAEDIDYIITSTEEEAFLLENNLIKKYQPPYNSLLKWDTWYVYIKIDTKGWEYVFPQIKFTRYKDPDWSIYIGPKPWKKDLKKMLQFLRYIFKFRTCSNSIFKKKKLCSDYTFWLCKGWCVLGWDRSEEIRRGQKRGGKDWNSIDDYVEEYKKIVDLIVNFFKGDTKPVEELILKEIEKAVEKQSFERAARLRDIYFNLQKFVEKQNVVLDESISWYYFLVKQIWTYIVFVMVNFYNWKLIDIIKHKEKNIDQNIDDLLKQIEREIWKIKIIERGKDFIIWTNCLDYNFADLESLKEFLFNQLDSIIVSSSFEKENILNEVLSSIRQKLNLKNFPYKIEALDISHLSWWRTSWAIVSFVWWIPYKRWYRRYKIKSDISHSDDFWALKEVLIRRFKLDKKIEDIEILNLPDLFVIDWWKGQLWVILDLLSKYPLMQKIFEKVDFVSIWKWAARRRKWKVSWEIEKIYYFDKNLNIKEKDISEGDFSILLKARDEAHRFSNKYRQKQMSMEWR
jgi:excinuclease ABC subunit C